MTKKLYLGNVGHQIYMTETGIHYTDDKTYKALTEFHGIENKELLKEDLEKTINTILICIGRKNRPFEIAVGNELQNAIDDVKDVFRDYFPNVTITKYKPK
ncbi:MAG: hypothetical protein ACP5N2_05100 [Candidatus Nanoarchaeia archaeon]